MTFDPFGDIFAKGDAIAAELDALLAPDRARRGALRDQLRAIVARLDDSGPPEQPEPGIERPDRDRDSRRPSSAWSPEQEVQLPQRTTPGGPFGPKVREKLIRVALGEERDW